MIRARNGWQRFWDRGGWWRPFLLAILYLLVYNAIGFAIGRVFADQIDAGNPTGSASSVLFELALPILLGGVVLLLVAISLRWSGEILLRQPVRGAWWMWIAVVIVVIPVILRVAATGWSSYASSLVVAVLFLGLCIGFTEELITRGLTVTMLRRGGYSERVVMVLSSAVFGLLHASNILSGQAPLTVAITVAYAFGFGAMMYLVMRATGSIVWAMLLHAATDPTTILATGGIDAHGDTADAEGLIGIAGIFNILYIAFAVVAIFLIRGRVDASHLRNDVSADHGARSVHRS